MATIKEVPLDPSILEAQQEWAEKAKDYQRSIVEQTRRQEYMAKSDPLFFKWQAGESSKEEWLAARNEIVEQYPYPELPS